LLQLAYVILRVEGMSLICEVFGSLLLHFNLDGNCLHLVADVDVALEKLELVFLRLMHVI